MRRALLPLLALLLLLPAAAAKDDPEAKAREKIAGVWIEYARWLCAKDQKAEAQEALQRARELAPQAKDLDAVAQEVDALAGEAAEDAALPKRREQARKEAAQLYDKLGRVDHEPADDARFDGYLLLAAELDPSKGRLGKLAGLVKQLAGNRANAERAGRLLVRLRELDPQGKHDALEQQLARDDVALVKSPGHPMVGYLSLPKSWKRGARLPVLVAVEGAGCGFLGRARDAAKTRGARDYLVLSPCALSNTNELQEAKYPWYGKALLDEGNRDRIGFDVQGLLKLLELLKERYGADERFAITGFSGGGNLCYAMTVLFPGRVIVSAPACANFSGLGFRDAKPVEGGGPPVRILTGAEDEHREFTFGKKDSPGIEPQTDRAVAALEGLGFKDLRRTMLKGVGHSPCAREVWEVIDEVSEGGK
jgi:dienelactone hydrolase